jgi:heptosyltransferase-2
MPFSRGESMRVGVMLPNWVGDVVMATPALRTLRQHLPDARIVGISKPHLIPLLDGTPWLDRTVSWNHHGPGKIGRGLAVVRQLRAERLDLLILFRASLSAGIAARLAGAKRTIGFRRRGLGWLLTVAVREPVSAVAAPASTVDSYLNLVRAAGFEPASNKLELATTIKDEQAAEDVWNRLRLPPGEQIMLLNAGAAYGEAKRWPTEYCVSLALRAADEFQLTTLVLCGPSERSSAEAIERAANHPRVRSLAGEDVSFGTTKAIIRRARLMVTTDSGPRHMASALGTPTVVLFGPIDPRLSRNYQDQTIELRVDLDCSPCGRRVCPLGHHRCMRDLTVDRVLAAVGQMLEQTASREAA